MDLIDSNTLSSLTSNLAFTGISLLKIEILAFLLLIIIFGGSKTFNLLVRIVAFVIFLIVLFGLINV